MNSTTARFIFGCAAVFLVGLFANASAQVSQITSAKDRTRAPALSLLNAQGKQVRLSDYRGKVVLLDFWATDCGGCRIEIPEYVQIQAAYKNKGLAVVGVSMDIMYEDLNSAKEAWDRVNPFAEQQKVNYPILMGDARTPELYGINSLPATYLLDRSGRIAASYVGVLVDKGNVEKNIDLLLDER
ncbi:MAG TPA: TlpA disulfide reductase family protein [Candidatus Acidoferrales bacterium]|nr:TlpA disulfide reductase family protein [Candidatus Acidoferrales bacterium]